MSRDAISRIKKRLNYDQRNIVSARVVSVNGSKATVRLPDGSTRIAYTADTVTADSLVSVTISGSAATITGDANLQPTGGLKTVIL